MLTPGTTRAMASTPACLGALFLALLSTTGCGGTDEVLYRSSAGASDLEEQAASEMGEPTGEEAQAGDVEPPSLTIDEAAAAERKQELASALNDAQRQWAQQGSTDYSVKAQRSCFCAPRAEDHVLVKVEAGHVVSAFGQSSSGAYDIPIETPSRADWYTVLGMFGRIEANLRSADRIEVVFDTELGFPIELAFDYRLVSAEEGEHFSMWDFQPVAAQ